MEIRNLIRPNATVVQITEIGVGDIYKRLETPSYGDPTVVMGTVTEVLNNGEQASLVTLEFTPEGYGQDYKATVKVFTDKSEVALFPVTVDEFRGHLSKAIEKQLRVVAQAERDLRIKRTVMMAMGDARDSALSIPVVKEIQG